ncbi:hypothetical protein T07_5199 [Trichinella nelsoni]|uniref:Uncharacterized protein n=1 Tax=Trichinella nelsoni TaxID=6336 RepID=A0A0V0REH2_9BILA|nr:hypothetical protein T07_5199 [Trichinella nelsoni]
MIITLRQSSSAGARIDLSCGLCRFKARTDANQCSPGVSMAFSSRSSVPLLITNIAADGTQIAFPTVLMFFLVTQVRNCEDGRILNDLHRITRERKVLVNGLQPEATPRAKFQKILKFSKNCLRHSPRRSLRAYKNLHITLRRLKICIKTSLGQILCYKLPGDSL